MKTEKLFWGLGFILLAVVVLLDALGVTAPLVSAVGELSLISLVLGLLLLSYTITRLTKGKIAEIFLPLALFFMLFEKNVARLCGLESPDILHNGLVLGCAVLLSIGFSILLPQTGGHVRILKSGKDLPGGANLSAAACYIDAADFVEERMENNLGSLVIHFVNAEAYKGGGVLYVDNNLGSTVVNVPAGWQYVRSIDNTLGAVTARQEGNPSGPLLTIRGDNNLGSITIRVV